MYHSPDSSFQPPARPPPHPPVKEMKENCPHVISCFCLFRTQGALRLFYVPPPLPTLPPTPIPTHTNTHPHTPTPALIHFLPRAVKDVRRATRGGLQPSTRFQPQGEASPNLPLTLLHLPTIPLATLPLPQPLLTRSPHVRRSPYDEQQFILSPPFFRSVSFLFCFVVVTCYTSKFLSV